MKQMIASDVPVVRRMLFCDIRSEIIRLQKGQLFFVEGSGTLGGPVCFPILADGRICKTGNVGICCLTNEVDVIDRKALGINMGNWTNEHPED